MSSSLSTNAHFDSRIANLVFSAAARPAYDNGTVLDWATWLMQQHGVAPQALGVGEVGGMPAVLGQFTSESDLGPMFSHFAFFEDGQRLVQLSITGPQALPPAAAKALRCRLSAMNLLRAWVRDNGAKSSCQLCSP